jgi:shikimate 5-dehydrogenase/shikimate kinase
MADGRGGDAAWASVLVAAPPCVRRPDDLRTLATAADLVELRFDLLLGDATSTSVAAWIEASPRPVLATVRSRAEGGAFDVGADAAARLLEEAARAGAAWIDAEEEVLARLGDLPSGCRVLASAHGTVAARPAFAVGDARVDACKLARPVDDAAAWRALREEADALAGTGAFLVPYGRLGAARGAFVGPGRPGFLYGSAGDDAAVVAGQPRLDVLLEELRAGEVGPDADLFGLVGAPPARSPSPALHNAVFRALGREALYLPLSGFALDEALALPVQGLSVTQPFKVEAAARADRLGPEAKASDSVNTLVRTSDGAWVGHNTDALALRSLVPPAAGARNAVVYGSGGLARAAVRVFADLGYAVRIHALVEDEGRELATRGKVEWGGPEYERRTDDAVVLNATPAGADGRALPAFHGRRLDGLVVVDAPYARGGVETGLLRQALADGAARCVDGLAFLAEQALFQARLFGAPDDDALDLRRVLGLALEPPANLVLVGARGSGKTAVGARVARTLGRPFLDLDADVERASGRAPGTWIEEDGWERFREVEHEALVRAVARRGTVVAAGGGVVELESNRSLLSRSGVVVYLKLPPEVAAARVEADDVDRPRWPGATDGLDESRRLLARREPFWTELAHHVVDASEPLAKVASAVADCWL